MRVKMAREKIEEWLWERGKGAGKRREARKRKSFAMYKKMEKERNGGQARQGQQ